MNKILTLLTFSALFFNVPNLFGAFQVKIAVYKNYANFTNNISKVGRERYRKDILIEEKNHLYYITSILYEKEKDAKKALLSYQKVFIDAFVMEIEQKKEVSVLEKDTVQIVEPLQEDLVQEKQESEVVVQKDVLEKVPVQESQMQETSGSEAFVEEAVEQVPLLDAKMLLENKTVYICEEERLSRRNSTIIRMEFKKDYVVYRKRKKGTHPLNIAYSFDQDRLILPMSGVDFQYKLYKEEKDFLLVQGFINGKKSKIFRYYFDESTALAFVARH